MADYSDLLLIAPTILLLLGTVHLAYTFRGARLTPRDASLQWQMSQVSPVITAQTTMWKCWIGFNASHGLGAMLFGLVYGYLLLAHPQWLFASHFLMMLGLVVLCSYALLGRAYWFSVPNTGIGMALLAYLLGALLAHRA